MFRIYNRKQTTFAEKEIFSRLLQRSADVLALYSSFHSSLSHTFKNEFCYIYYFRSDEESDRMTYEFIYGKYNHKRPHTHNGGLTPSAARSAA